MTFRNLSLALTLGLALTLTAPDASAQRGPNRPLVMVESDAFEDGGIVPPKYVSDFAGGDNVQPGFTFSNLPDNAVSIAIIFHDLDVSLNGGTEDVLHWTAWNIPASAGGIPEGSLPEGSVDGNSIRGTPGYMGPGAPAGERYHHYVFEFYVLSENLDLPVEGTGREELLAAMQGMVVGKAAYVGRFRQ